MGGLTSLTFNELGENHELNIIHGITRAITFLIPKLIMDVPLHLSTNYAPIFFLQSYFWKFIIHKNTNFLDIDSSYIEEEKKNTRTKDFGTFQLSFFIGGASPKTVTLQGCVHCAPPPFFFSCLNNLVNEMDIHMHAQVEEIFLLQ